MRLEQRDQRRALIAALPRQLDGRKELRAGVADIGGGGSQLRFLAADVRPLRQEVRRQAGRHPRRRQPVQRAAGKAHCSSGGSRHQNRQRVGVLVERLAQAAAPGPSDWPARSLLRDVEIGAGAGLLPLPDRIENTRGARDVASAVLIRSCDASTWK